MQFPDFYHFRPHKQESGTEVKTELTTAQISITENKTEIQTNEVATKTLLGVEPINRGAVKIVWGIKSSTIGSSGQNSLSMDPNQNVYYTPVVSFTKSNQEELKREYDTMQEIKSTALSKNLSIEHLAVEAEEVSEEEKPKEIKGEYTLKVPRADRNFEDVLLDPGTSVTRRIALGADFLDGLASLHGTGRAYGDIKPENCLIYGNTLKIADFGKTVKLSENETASYKGNTRYAPPEGVLSQKGDVYGAAMVLIRLFEEECLKGTQETSLLEPTSEDQKLDIKASSKLRGIEKFVVDHKAFSASNPGFSLGGFARRALMKSKSVSSMEEQSKAISIYITYLKARLVMGGKLTPAQADNLSNLLRHMTEPAPSKRISMQDASKEYNKIFEDK